MKGPVKLEGSLHPLYRGGTWKERIISRDKETCCKCGLREKEIMEVDHIKPESTHPELRRDPSNLQTLCPNCHKRKTVQERSSYPKLEVGRPSKRSV